MNTFSRFISLFVSLCLFFNQCIWASPDLKGSVLRSFNVQTNDFASFRLPQKLGTVEHLFTPQNKADFPPVIHIRTAHGLYSNTKQVSKIVDYLSKEYGVKVLYIEGASESLRPELLNFFPDKQLNVEFIERLVKAGRVTGGELALLNSNNKLLAHGVENADLYREAYQAYKSVMKQQSDVRAYLAREKNALDLEASRVFDSETLRIVKLWLRFEMDPRDLLASLKDLEAHVKRDLDMDLSDPLMQFQWPHLVRLSLLRKLEEGIRLQDHASEILKLKREYGRVKTQALLDALEEPQPQAPRQFYEQYFAKHGFILEHYPQLTFKVAHQVIQGEIDPASLMDEAKRLFKGLKNTAAQNKDQKNLMKKYEAWLLLSNLSQLKLAREDWDSLNAAELIANSSQQPWLKQAIHFYRLAEEREEVFLQNMLQSPVQNLSKPVVLITGGFHDKGMQNLFEKNDIAYALLTPHLSSLEGNTYHEVMIGSAHLEQTPLLQSASASEQHEWDLRNEVREVAHQFRLFAKEQKMSRSEMRVLWSRSSYAKDRRSKSKRRSKPGRTLSIESLEDRNLLSGIESGSIEQHDSTSNVASVLESPAEVRTVMNDQAEVDYDFLAQNMMQTSYENDKAILREHIHAAEEHDEIVLEVHEEAVNHLKNMAADGNKVTLSFEATEGDHALPLATHEGQSEIDVESFGALSGDVVLHLESLGSHSHSNTGQLIVHVHMNGELAFSVQIEMEEHFHGVGPGFGFDQGATPIDNSQGEQQGNNTRRSTEDHNHNHDHGHSHSHGEHGHGEGGGSHTDHGHPHGDEGGGGEHNDNHPGSSGPGDQGTFGLSGNGGSDLLRDQSSKQSENHGHSEHLEELELHKDHESHSDSLNSEHSEHQGPYLHSDDSNNSNVRRVGRHHFHDDDLANILFRKHLHVLPILDPFLGFLSGLSFDRDENLVMVVVSEEEGSLSKLLKSGYLKEAGLLLSWRSFTVIPFLLSLTLSFQLWRGKRDFMRRYNESRSSVSNQEKRRMENGELFRLSVYALTLLLLMAIPAAFLWEHPQKPAETISLDRPDVMTPEILSFKRDMINPQQIVHGLYMLPLNSEAYEISLPPSIKGHPNIVVFEMMNQRREVAYSLHWMAGKNGKSYFRSTNPDSSHPPLFDYDPLSKKLRFDVPNQALTQGIERTDLVPQFRVWATRHNGVFSAEEIQAFGVNLIAPHEIQSWQEAEDGRGVIPPIEVKEPQILAAEDTTHISRRFFAEVHAHDRLDRRAYTPRQFTNDIQSHRGLKIHLKGWGAIPLESITMQLNSDRTANHATLAKYTLEKKEGRWESENGIRTDNFGKPSGDYDVIIPFHAIPSGIVSTVHFEVKFKSENSVYRELPPLSWSFYTGDPVSFGFHEVYRLQQARYPQVSLDSDFHEAEKYLPGTWIRVPRRVGHMIQALKLVLTDTNGNNSLWSIERSTADFNRWVRNSNMHLGKEGWKGVFTQGDNVQEVALQPVFERNGDTAFFVPREALAGQISMTPHAIYEAEHSNGHVGSHRTSFPDLEVAQTKKSPQGFEGIFSEGIPPSFQKPLIAKPNPKKASSVLFDVAGLFDSAEQQARDFRSLPPNAIFEMTFENSDIVNWPQVDFHFQYLSDNQPITFHHPIGVNGDVRWTSTDPNDPKNKPNMSIDSQTGKLIVELPAHEIKMRSFHPWDQVEVIVGNSHNGSRSYDVKGKIKGTARFKMPPESRSEVRSVTPFFLAFHVFGGMIGLNWSQQKRLRYSAFMREKRRQSKYGAMSVAEVDSKIKMLNDRSKDSIGLTSLTKQMKGSPLIIQFISRALSVEDKEHLVDRLNSLPDRSVVVEYTERGETSVLAAEMRHFPNLQYVRKSYVGKLDIKTINKELKDAQSLIFSENNKNVQTGFLMASREDFHFTDSDDFENLGFVLMLQDETLQAYAPLMRDSIRAAVFGHLIELVKLDREIRDSYLRQKMTDGHFGAITSFFSIENLWVDLRASAHLSTQA